MREASSANNVLVAAKVSASLLFVAVGGAHIVSHADSSNYRPFLPRGVGGIFSGASIILARRALRRACVLLAR